METTFLIIFTLLFLVFQTYCASSSNTTITASSNVTCIEKERQSLLLIKQGLGDESNRLSTWTGLECCVWHGVECDRRTGRVVKLDLSLCGFNSTIPVSLSNLTALVHLDLYSNNFHGGIPDSIGNLSSLSYMDLSENQLCGPIPPSLGGLSSLTDLYLDSNQLSGSIPESIGQLSNLQSLGLSGNRLSGNIPTSLGQLSNLLSLYLDNNSLSGVVSEIHFTKLINLTHLDLSDNPLLRLNVSPHWIPPFQLSAFGASSCNMGPQFPNWLQTSTGLEFLFLSNSGIRDRIPEWFQNISSHLLRLDLSDNQIGPQFPSFLQTANTTTRFDLQQLYLSNTRIRDTIPEWFLNISSHLWYLDLSDNEIGGDLAQIITNNTGLKVVALGNNRFTGIIPTNLCELHSIRVLDLSHNNFFGILPGCLGSLIQLKAMDLTSNNITGDIPNSLGALPYLESLHLHNNKFEGNLPMSLQNLTNLVTMDLGNNLLTGNIPFWIGKNLSNLKILNLQSNMFMGKISLELCQIKTLQYLSLASNNITGNIPQCFGNLTGMIKSDDKLDNYYNEYEENIEAYIKGIQLRYTSVVRFLISLDLSSNKLTGEIPDALMNIEALKNLNLSRNELSGHIPRMIGNLKSMESLDLSTNKLSGRIPQSLASLDSLCYLNLSFNKLSGPLPTGSHFQTFDNSTYEGNNGLCGFPLLNCKGNLPHIYVGDDGGENGSHGFSWFYTGMVSGFVVGFMGLIVSLQYIRIWRVTYFKVIENVYVFLMVSVIVTFARLRRKTF